MTRSSANQSNHTVINMYALETWNFIVFLLVKLYMKLGNTAHLKYNDIIYHL